MRRLWNSTLAEDYPKVDRVNIGSSAKIIVPQQVVIQQNNLTDDSAEVGIEQLNN
jgi:integrin alpha 7